MYFIKLKSLSNSTPRFRAESVGVTSRSSNFVGKYFLNLSRSYLVPFSINSVLSGFNLSLLAIIQHEGLIIDIACHLYVANPTGYPMPLLSSVGQGLQNKEYIMK